MISNNTLSQSNIPQLPKTSQRSSKKTPTTKHRLLVSNEDYEQLNSLNKSSNISFNSDFCYIKRRKYAMYNSEVKKKCIELVFI